MNQKTKLNFIQGINSPVVLFLHAFPLNHMMWKSQFDLMNTNTISFIAPDFPGFGESSLLKMPPSIDNYAKVIFDLLKNNGISKLIVISLSMGGYVALSLYRQYPNLFQGLILADTRAAADSETIKLKRFTLIKQIRNTGNLQPVFDNHLKLFYTLNTRKKNKHLIIDTRKMMEKNTVPGIIWAQQAMRDRDDSTGLLKQMDFPVLILLGENDPLVSKDEAEEMANACKNGELKIITNAAHLSNLENPDIFNRHIMEYLLSVL